MRVQLQHAYILHRRAYKDTSLIVELWTREFGRLSAVARGARRSRNNALIQPFQPIFCSWFGRGELFTLGKVEPAGVYQKINGHFVLSGLYLNELLMRLVPKEEQLDELYRYYEEAVAGLTQLSTAWDEHQVDQNKPDLTEQRILRRFETGLLKQLGYGLDLSAENGTGTPICITSRYTFIPEKGLVQVPQNNTGVWSVSGASLLALATDQLDSAENLREIKRLLRYILDQYLGDRPLQSRQLRQMYERQKKLK